MTSSSHTITLQLSPDSIKRLSQVADLQHMTIEEAAASLLGEILHKKRTKTVTIIHPEKSHQIVHEQVMVSEIIKRQDAEILWLREQVNRLLTSTQGSDVTHQDHSIITKEEQLKSSSMPDGNKAKSFELNQESHDISSMQSSVTVDDVQYSPISDSEIISDELLPSHLDHGSEIFRGHQSVGDRTIRDSIGGVRGEMEYLINEAAAIAGESEATILEYIINGFLPAIKEGDTYLIRGNDLQRYMMSR